MNAELQETMFEQELAAACAQLRRARMASLCPVRKPRRFPMALAACFLALLLAAAGAVRFFLPDHAGQMRVEPVYGPDGTQADSEDGYPLWVVLESDDPDMVPGTYLVVDPATNDYAVYAPPSDSTKNQSSPRSPAHGALFSPVQEYAGWHILENGALCIYAEKGTPLYALSDGTVTEAAYSGAEGYRLTITCENGERYQYTHCSGFSVTVGDTVSAGQQVASVGATGRADRPLCVITAPDEWDIRSFFS